MLLECLLFFLKTILGYLYPIWASLLVICTINTTGVIISEDSAKWLSYWVLIAILHNSLFPVLDYIVEIDAEHFQAICLLIKTMIMTYLNFPQIDGCLTLYQRFVFSNEQIESMKFCLRKKLKRYVDLIDLRDFCFEQEDC